MVATLKASGVRRVYGLPGDSLTGFTDGLRRDGEITREHVRHEEAAGFAEIGTGYFQETHPTQLFGEVE
jgi:pyruvate dehydrogenase (quinone)